jgi:hypothetical protein
MAPDVCQQLVRLRVKGDVCHAADVGARRHVVRHSLATDPSLIISIKIEGHTEVSGSWVP